MRLEKVGATLLTVYHIVPAYCRHADISYVAAIIMISVREKIKSPCTFLLVVGAW